MKKTFPPFLLLLLGALSFSTSLQAEPWKPDEDAAVFTICPNQVLGSPYFKEVLKAHGFLEFAYSAIINDQHVVALQNEIGFQIEDTSEISFMMGNFLETMVNLPSSTSGNYDVFARSSPVVILRTKGEVPPDTFFEKFDRWASGPAFHPNDIERFRRDTRIEPEKIEEMSKARRLKSELYRGMEKSEKFGKTTLFEIPVGALNPSTAKEDLNKMKISMGMQTEKGATTFAWGSKEEVLGFFAHENQRAPSSPASEGDSFASFSIPMDGEMLKKLEAGQLSDPNGPLGPLATILGEAAYKIRKIAGRSKIAGGRAHVDLTLSCTDAESAQAIWSVAQASLGMAQLRAMRQQMKNPQSPPTVPLNFLSKIKLKNIGNEVHAHFEATPAEVFPKAANLKWP
jgi:hypothetical protein